MISVALMYAWNLLLSLDLVGRSSPSRLFLDMALLETSLQLQEDFQARVLRIARTWR
jgi:hypothetical protein